MGKFLGLRFGFLLSFPQFFVRNNLCLREVKICKGLVTDHCVILAKTKAVSLKSSHFLGTIWAL